MVGGRRAFSYESVPTKDFTNYHSSKKLTLQQSVPFLASFIRWQSVPLFQQGLNSLQLQEKQSCERIPQNTRRSQELPCIWIMVMLPLDFTNSFQIVEILICGGAPENAYNKLKSGNFRDALNNCVRVVITDRNPRRSMEKMPRPRVMPDMVILPNWEILIINGAQMGSDGWDLATDPSYSPFLYRSNETLAQWIYVLSPSTIVRLYHSIANILHDGRVLVGGSNPHVGYSFSGEKFPTELHREAYNPYHLDVSYKNLRPINTSVTTPHSSIAYGSNFTVEFLIDLFKILIIPTRI